MAMKWGFGLVKGSGPPCGTQGGPIMASKGPVKGSEGTLAWQRAHVHTFWHPKGHCEKKNVPVKGSKAHLAPKRGHYGNNGGSWPGKRLMTHIFGTRRAIMMFFVPAKGSMVGNLAWSRAHVPYSWHPKGHGVRKNAPVKGSMGNMPPKGVNKQ